MTGLGDAPAYVKALPPAFRRQIAKQCGGDWRRVTLDDDGGITVHNTPQREDIATEVAAVIQRSAAPERWSEPEPIAEPVRVRTQIPRSREVDTTNFTRIELPAVAPKTKKVAKKKPPPPLYPPIKEPDPDPGPVMVGQVPLSVPLSRRRDYVGTPEFLGSPKPQPPPRPGPLPARPVAKAESKQMRRRTGAPRTGFELLKRLLDLGCTYERLPASPFAKIYWEGLSMGLVTCADSAPAEQVLKDFKRCKRQIWKLKGPKTERPRGGIHPGSSAPTTGNQIPSQSS